MTVTDCADAHSAPATVVADLKRWAKFTVRYYLTCFLVLGLVSTGRAEDLHPREMVGTYAYAVPGSTDVLSLDPAGTYSLSTKGFDGRSSRLTFREEGFWKFDGWAIVLEPKVASPGCARRLFPQETEAGGRLLVSALRRRHSSGEYYFSYMFIPGSEAPPSLPDKQPEPNKALVPTPMSVTPAASAPVAPATGAAHL